VRLPRTPPTTTTVPFLPNRFLRKRDALLLLSFSLSPSAAPDGVRGSPGKTNEEELSHLMQVSSVTL
jgi:hypothetical protein